MTAGDREFLRARTRDERRRADAATDECARRAHLELARLYRERLAGERGAGLIPSKHDTDDRLIIASKMET